jgi:magnesium transporter
METRILDDILARLRHALERDDIITAATIIENLRPHDQAEIFSELPDEDQIALLPELDPTDSADILEKLDEQDAAELAANLSTEALVRIVDEMEPDEAADLLGDIAPEQAQTVLAGLVDPDEVHPLLLHPDNTAGGLMTSEFLALRRRMTAAEALIAIRAWKPDTEAIYYLFVVDAQDRLAGVVSLRQIIIASPDTVMADLMNPEVISVSAGVDQEECAQLMSHYDLLALPVLFDADCWVWSRLTRGRCAGRRGDRRYSPHGWGTAARPLLPGEQRFPGHAQADQLAPAAVPDREPDGHGAAFF